MTRLPTPVSASRNSTTLPASATTGSRQRLVEAIAIGATSAAAPSINRLLAILEPTMLPQAIAGDPMRAASILVTSSGMDVPRPTITTPMTSALTPAFSASATAPRTSNSPPKTSATRPKTVNKRADII